MKTSNFLAPALLASALGLAGCYTPQPTTLYRSDKLPETHWYEVKESDSRIAVLPAALRQALVQQRQQVADELAKDGQLSAATNKKISDLDESCNGAFLVSFDSVASNPTPEMNGQLESWDRRRQNDSMIFDQNLRALADEWSRLWLMERPGGSPYDTVNTSGRY